MKNNNRKNENNNGDSNVLQKLVNLGLSLYSNKDNLLGKAQTVINRATGSEKPLDLEEIKDRFTALVRMVKAVARREYTDVSPLFLLKTGFAITYFKYGNDFIEDDGSFFSIADDLLVASWAVKSLYDEIAKFERWEQESQQVPAGAEQAPAEAV